MLMGVIPVSNASDVVEMPIASTSVVYTKSIRVGNGMFFGIYAKAGSSIGTPSIKVEMQQGFTEPTTEGAADDNWVEPDGFDDIFSEIADKLMHIKTITPVPGLLVRFKITGGSSNPSDATLNLKLSVQEQA